MITTADTATTITCDKCKRESTAPSDCYNTVFWEAGWVLNKGRKYMHLCFWCLSPKKQRAMNFVKEKMGL